jgi:SAM-dependent methyltransferase
MPERFELRQSWDAAHQSQPLSDEPEAGVVAFLEHLRPQLPSRAPLLDAGCGRGRNVLTLSQAGLPVYACDLSLATIGIAKSRAREAGAPVRFQAANLASLPYVENFFAATICVHVLPYHCKAGILKCLHELWRVLQPNGWLYFDLLDPEDAEYGRGDKLEDDTFLGPDGMPLHFSPRQELEELAQGFALVQVSRHEFNPSPARRRVAWRIWALKCGAG